LLGDCPYIFFYNTNANLKLGKFSYKNSLHCMVYKVCVIIKWSSLLDNDYIHRGVGFCILHIGQIVCCASSYSVYDDGIEIEIDTHPDCRRKRLATVAASALILDCLDRGKYPSWDAANLESVALAKKLGYVLHDPYDTYYIHSEMN